MKNHCLFQSVDPSKVLKRARDKIPNLVGIKHSSRELNNAHNCTLVDPNRFQVLMGTDSVSMRIMSQFQVHTVYIKINQTFKVIFNWPQLLLQMNVAYSFLVAIFTIFHLCIDVPVTAPYMGTLFYKLKTAYDSGDTKSAQAIQVTLQSNFITNNNRLNSKSDIESCIFNDLSFFLFSFRIGFWN